MTKNPASKSSKVEQDTSSNPSEATSLTGSDKKSKPAIESAMAYVLPFLAFMIIAMRYPDVQPDSIDDISVDWYFYLVIAQVVVCGGLVAFFFRQIVRKFPVRMDHWGVIVGVVGIVVWIGFCELGIERRILTAVGLESWLGERVGFNPFAQITNDGRRWAFLLFRFSLLALVVPVIEELFLRAWFIRFMEDPDWQKIALASLGTAGYIWSVSYGVLTHPGEAIAAAVWFGMVTWLMFKTGKLWNCILAHAVTNLLLGIYIVTRNDAWHYW